jgi:hypothetical protein
MCEVVQFYKSNNIPFDMFVEDLTWSDKKYVLIYYDIFPCYQTIQKYGIYIDPYYKDDLKFLILLVKKYVENKEYDKLSSLLKMFKITC